MLSWYGHSYFESCCWVSKTFLRYMTALVNALKMTYVNFAAVIAGGKPLPTLWGLSSSWHFYFQFSFTQRCCLKQSGAGGVEPARSAAANAFLERCFGTHKKLWTFQLFLLLILCLLACLAVGLGLSLCCLSVDSPLSLGLLPADYSKPVPLAVVSLDSK